MPVTLWLHHCIQTILSYSQTHTNHMHSHFQSEESCVSNKRKEGGFNKGCRLLSTSFYSKGASPDCWLAVSASHSVLPSPLPSSLCLSVNVGDVVTDELAATSDLLLNQLLTRSWEDLTIDRLLISLSGSSKPKRPWVTPKEWESQFKGMLVVSIIKNLQFRLLCLHSDEVYQPPSPLNCKHSQVWTKQNSFCTMMHA